jgi:hypothetical protein
LSRESIHQRDFNFPKIHQLFVILKHSAFGGIF